jgi:undecaprenyl-diphosphatase
VPHPVVPEQLRIAATVVTGTAALGFGFLAIRYRGASGPGLLDAQAMGRLGSALRAYSGAVDVVVRAGDPGPVLLIGVGTAAVAARMRRPRLVALALAAPLLTGLVTTAAKWVVGRTLDGDLSLPSGHTGAVTSLAVVAALLSLGRRRWSPVAPAAHLLLVTLVAATMGAALVATRAHYATDTIAGYCAGLAVTLVAARLLDACCDRRLRRLAAAGATVTSTRAAEPEGAR